MEDPNTGVQEVAEAPAQSDPAPESQEPVVDQPQTQQPESPEAETGKNEDGEIPKDKVAWAAMRAENNRLKKALESTDPAYLESLRNATSPQGYQQPRVPQVTEDADYSQVTQHVNWTQDQAIRANREVALLRQQMELQQDREAERAYPELKTNKAFQQIVAEKKLAARVLGHERTTLDIAEEVSQLLSRRDEEVVAKASQATREQIAQARVISSEPKGTTSGGRSSVDNEELRNKVRKGDQEATTEVAKGLIADLEF